MRASARRACTSAGGARGSAAFAPGATSWSTRLALVALTMIGIVGFRPAYGGHGYLAAGAAGVLLGLLLSHAGQRARLPLLAVVAASILAFLLFGGVISQTGTVSLPVLQLGRGRGGLRLAAAADHRPAGRPHRRAARAALPARPVQRRGRARARAPHHARRPRPPPRPPSWSRCPSCSARRSRPPPCSRAPGSPPSRSPGRRRASSAAPGARPRIGRQRPWQRIGAAAAVLAVAGAGATVIVGPHLPGADAHQRVVLYVEPPFDVSRLPEPARRVPRLHQGRAGRASASTARNCSPPPGCRRAAGCASRRWTPTTGSPGASPTPPRPGSSFGGFQRVGALLPGAVPGRDPAPRRSPSSPPTTQPWLPDLAGTTGFAFTGPAGARHRRRRSASTSPPPPGSFPAACPPGCATRSARRRCPRPPRPRLAAASPERHARLVPDDPRRRPGVRAGALGDRRDHAHGQGPRARQRTCGTTAGTATAAAAQSVITAGHGSGRLHHVPRGQADHRRRRAVRRRRWRCSPTRSGCPPGSALTAPCSQAAPSTARTCAPTSSSTRPSTAG